MDVMDKVKHRSDDGKVEYYILDLDAGGYPRDQTIEGLLREELMGRNRPRDAPTPRYTDVVVISHGWNTQRASDGSIPLANRVVAKMEECKPADRRVLYVAVKWPSFLTTVFEPSKDDDPKSVVSGVMKKLRQTVAEAEDSAVNPTEQFNVAQAATAPESLAAADECEAALESFITADEANSTAAVSARETATDGSLPEDVRVALAKFANEIGKQSGRVNADDSSILDDGEKYGVVTPEMVENSYQNVRAKNLKPPTKEPEVQSRSFTVAGVFGAIGVAKKAWDVANTIFDVVFGTFERRAAIVGSRGVHWCLADMMERASPKTRFHLFGHSLGCHVVQSAAIGRSPGSKLSRKIRTMFLGQAAVPSHVYGRGGAYRPIVSRLKPVAGPILASIYEMDPALMLYDVFLPRPVGRFGLEVTDPFPAEDLTLEAHGERSSMQKFDFKPSTVYNIQGGPVVTGHGDIADREVMDVFWQAASIDIHEKDAEVVESSKLPYGFWSNYKIRSEKSGGSFCAIM